SAHQPYTFVLTETAPDPVYLPGLKGEGQAFRAHMANGAERFRAPFLPAAELARGDRKEQVRICGGAGSTGAPVSLIGHNHSEPREMFGGLVVLCRCPGNRASCGRGRFFY